MKYDVGTILYFKPKYVEFTKECWVCQVVKYHEESNKYLVILSDIYSPCHYYKSFISENDLGDIHDTFVLNEVSYDSLIINLSIKEVMKLRFIDLYK